MRGNWPLANPTGNKEVNTKTKDLRPNLPIRNLKSEMNSLLLGPLLGNNRKKLIERCAELVANNQSHKFLYLAASRPLLEIVTDGILDGTRNRGVWGELPVYLFRGFVRHVLRNAVDVEGK